MRRLARLAVCAAATGCAVAAPAALVPYRVTGDAILAPLTAEAGDPARGRNVLAGRDANCLLCHAVPETGERFMGNLSAPLSGVGARLDAGQLRLRVVDSSLLGRTTIMPAYYKVSGLNQVAAAFRDRPILSAQQVEDVVEYLRSLR